MVYEWMIKNYPNDLQWRRVRVGPLPGKEPDKLYGVLRRWVDGLIVTKTKVIIVEAKVKPDPGAISQLEVYRLLFPETPEFSSLKKRKIELVFLTSSKDPILYKLAKQKKIRYVVYCPKWLKEYLEEKAKRYIEKK